MSTQTPISALHPFEAAQRQRSFLVRLARYAFVVVFVVVTVLSLVGIGGGAGVETERAWGWPVILAIAALLAGATILVDLLTPNKKISTLVAVFVGLLVGVLVTLVISAILDLLVFAYDIRAPWIVATTKVFIGICLSYLGITTVLQTQDDFRLVIPYVEFAKQFRGPRPLVIDTSALIDARIADLAQTGLLDFPIVIPRFVVAELQQLADSGDRMKRTRGRRGLDVIARLQRSARLDVTIDETPVPGTGVDQMILEMARTMPATIVTTDTGLARVAGIHDVSVLNLNDVANALKPALVPGEEISLKVIKPGEQRGQGVGYLDDGTMVVVENGADLIGHTGRFEVAGSVQTSAGRLIFARPIGDNHDRQESDRQTDDNSPPDAENDDNGYTDPPHRDSPHARADQDPWTDSETDRPGHADDAGPPDKSPPRTGKPHPPHGYGRNPRR